jgi:hypothetical protein
MFLSGATPWARIMPKRGSKQKNVSDEKAPSKKKERLATEELVLQPWFLTPKVARTIRNLVPPDYRQRMHDCFNDYGCMRCDRLDVVYKSNGMCRGCMATIFTRIQGSAKRRLKDKSPRRYGKEFVAKAAQARNLLRGLFRGTPKFVRRGPRIKSVRLGSPVIDASDRMEDH